MKENSKMVKSYNQMRLALKEISRYSTLKQLQKSSEDDYGLSYTEALEMAYENVIGTAKYWVKWVQELKEDIK